MAKKNPADQTRSQAKRSTAARKNEIATLRRNLAGVKKRVVELERLVDAIVAEKAPTKLATDR